MQTDENTKVTQIVGGDRFGSHSIIYHKMTKKLTHERNNARMLYFRHCFK